jgi:hypoxanthine phosphoribosyltransferase
MTVKLPFSVSVNHTQAYCDSTGDLRATPLFLLSIRVRHPFFNSRCLFCEVIPNVHKPPDSENELFPNLSHVLYSREQISKRVSELGRQISADYAGKPLVLISILKGGIVFLADLMRAITIPHAFDVVGASSYRGGTSTTGKVIITKDAELDLRGKNIVLVEDILDTGHTLAVIVELLKIQQPASFDICCLLNKNRPRKFNIPLKYVGFDIPDEFVVGYGLDYNEHYRNLACIGVLKPEIYR